MTAKYRPMQHGFRAAEKPSQRGGFACVVCNRRVARGDPVVGFRNANKPGDTGWDHVCARPCANQYQSPPLVRSAPTPPSSSTAAAASTSGAAAGSSSASSQHRQAATKESYFRLAHNLGFFPEAASNVLERCNGDFMAASEQLTQSFAAGGLSGEGSDDGSEEGSDEGSSGEEEVLPDKPVAR